LGAAVERNHLGFCQPDYYHGQTGGAAARLQNYDQAIMEQNGCSPGIPTEYRVWSGWFMKFPE
jgi:hypothetical protein